MKERVAKPEIQLIPDIPIYTRCFKTLSKEVDGFSKVFQPSSIFVSRLMKQPKSFVYEGAIKMVVRQSPQDEFAVFHTKLYIIRTTRSYVSSQQHM
ncbi:hypothetical protein ABW19_dt0207648 [Dactylella cylindrospora]|nr:hypothetical protein ABW19_dt0207648 [Dactylella cylindrospora]